MDKTAAGADAGPPLGSGSKEPRERQWFEDVHADPDSPFRRGMYVRTTTQGEYVLTDGAGSSWPRPPENLVPSEQTKEDVAAALRACRGNRKGELAVMEWASAGAAPGPVDPNAGSTPARDSITEGAVSGVPGHGHGNDRQWIEDNVAGAIQAEAPFLADDYCQLLAKVAIAKHDALRSAGLLAGGPQPGGRE